MVAVFPSYGTVAVGLKRASLGKGWQKAQGVWSQKQKGMKERKSMAEPSGELANDDMQK